MFFRLGVYAEFKIRQKSFHFQLSGLENNLMIDILADTPTPFQRACARATGQLWCKRYASAQQVTNVIGQIQE
jgi:hypothetical protein